MPGDLCTVPRIISLSLLSLATDVSDAILGASGLWLGTRRGAGGTATLTKSFLATSHGYMDNRSSSNSIDKCLFRSQSTANLTNSLLIPAEMFVYFIIYPNTNHIIICKLEFSYLLCPLDTVQIFSDLHFPSTPPIPPCFLAQNCLVTPTLLWVHMHLFSSD